ncbi:protein YgfX [Endozoicomonadaceae bacterium StTr2]
MFASSWIVSSRTDTFSLRVRPSRLLLSCYLVIYAVSLVPLGLADLALSYKFLLVVLLGIWLKFQLCRHYFLTDVRSIEAVSFVQGEWRIRSRNQLFWCKARLLPTGWLLPWIIILPFETDRAPYRRTLILMRDSTTDTAMHRLRVLLRISAFKVTTPPRYGAAGLLYRLRMWIIELLPLLKQYRQDE